MDENECGISKIDEEGSTEEERDSKCCYVIDDCGCYVDPCCNTVSYSCCCC